MTRQIPKTFPFQSHTLHPNSIPQRILSTGESIPAIGLGTFGSDRFTPEEVAFAVLDAIAFGYRHIDCASIYGNEKEIGQVLELAINSGIPREEFWITSKLWNNMHQKGDVLLACAKSLRDLRLDYLDLYLVHWPFPNHHPPGCDASSRHPESKPFDPKSFLSTWRQMEKLVSMGLVKHIGTSNMTLAKFEAVWEDMKIKPTVNEMELHPHFQQQELFNWCTQHHIQPVGFCPLGSPHRPDRDQLPSDTVVMKDPLLLDLSKKRGVPPAILCLQWAIQRGQIPIPFSIDPNEYQSNLRACFENPLTQDEMDAIAHMDKNCRLIKGQVFLWEGAKGWESLWDE